jgi:hypothetical protein
MVQYVCMYVMDCLVREVQVMRYLMSVCKTDAEMCLHRSGIQLGFRRKIYYVAVNKKVNITSCSLERI